MLADFEYAREIGADSSEKQILRWKNRNPALMAPELLSLVDNEHSDSHPNHAVDEKANDIFQFGSVIFKLLFQTELVPSGLANNLDFRYQNLIEGNSYELWNDPEISTYIRFYDSACANANMVQVQDLLLQMLTPDPSQRITIKSVLAHEWLKDE